MFKLTRSHSVHWNALGRELNVSYNFREELKIEVTLSDDARLEAILNNWIETESSPVTWSTLIKALEAIKLKETAKQVKDFLRAIESNGKYTGHTSLLMYINEQQ